MFSTFETIFWTLLLRINKIEKTTKKERKNNLGYKPEDDLTTWIDLTKNKEIKTITPALDEIKKTKTDRISIKIYLEILEKLIFLCKNKNKAIAMFINIE